MAAGLASQRVPGVPGGTVAAVFRAQVQIRSDSGVVVVPVEQLRLARFAGSVPWRRWRSHRGQPYLPGCYWAATVADHVVYESRLELERLLLASCSPRRTGR
ncbi:hypothetical protein [Jidongwangia harbinensis]|uniref:hypothetical protein n=1 Tax=Jidongwangia harbinensis TaxID=2878561 RepID=UPI001CDA0C14|nr:hypothetical protein [Jidongwangia harbinensis]MCA2216336.1 hypothetical protein [Jidongwangia harbinensis]MCA2217071.1 hypothetical protein [Jidongwangia harbinensis]